MINTSDDYPHPVPPLAWIRWKENYFFLVMDPESKVYATIHLSAEPSFDRLRINCNISIDGIDYYYLRDSAFPKEFAMSPAVGDECITLNIEKSHELFRLDIATPELGGELFFRRRMPTFDFEQCKFAAPDLVSFREVLTLGYNLPFNHLQQAMSVTGSIKVRETGKCVTVSSYGYRDHGWHMNSDNLVLDHTWCGFNFADKAVGVMTIRTLARPGLEAKEGYVADENGVRPLRKIDVRQLGEANGGLPGVVIHEVEDVFGETLVITSDISDCYARLALYPEKEDGEATYKVVDVFSKSVISGSEEVGVSIVELGRSSALGGLVA